MNRWIAALSVAVLAAGATQASYAQGQGQGKGKSQGPDKPQAEQPIQLPSYGKENGKDYGKQNHGQVVSECNHRANDRGLKGHERKDFVEWCESRGPRYKYDYGRYGNERDCYQKANNKGLTGSKRDNFLDKCFGEVELRIYGVPVPVKR